MQRNPSVIAWLRLVRVVQKISGGGSAMLEETGMSGAQFDLLVTIAASPGATQQSAADDLAVTKGNISQLLEKLERAGYIERKQEGVSKRLYATDAGMRFVQEHLPQHDDYIAKKLGALDRDEIAQLTALLRKLEQSLP